MSTVLKMTQGKISAKYDEIKLKYSAKYDKIKLPIISDSDLGAIII